MWDIVKILILGILAGVIANFITRLLGRIIKFPPAPPLPFRLWNIAIPISVVFLVYYLIEKRWAISLEYQILVVIIYFVTAVSIPSILSIMLKTERYYFLIVALIVMFLSLYLLDKALPRYITIDCPDFVKDTEIIRGRVINSKWNVYIFVHPFKIPEWWVQQVTLPDQTGKWQANAGFGGVTGDSFQIIAVGSYQKNLYKEGETVYPNEISENAVKSRICEVVKK